MACQLFDFAAERLEHHSALDRLEARGTLRIALKEAGLHPERVTPGQLCVVLAKVMPSALTDMPPSSDPDEVFRRLGSA